MTGYTVHTGSNEKFTEGWDSIFSKGKAAKSAAKPRKSATKAVAKKSPGKAKAGKKKSGKK